MNYQGLFIILSILSTLSGIGLSLLGLRHRNVRGVQAFIAMTGGAAIWSFFYILEITSNDIDTILMWNRFIYIGVEIIPVAWLVFALQYTNTYQPGPKFIIMLCILPALSYIFVLTNWNGLFWANPVITQEIGFTTIKPGYGTVAWINILYTYVLITIGIVVLARRFIFNHDGVQKKPAVIILWVILLPFLGSILRVTILPVDIVPITFTASGLLLAFGVLNFDVLNLLPVAHDMVINNMPIGMMVLDLENRVLSTNKAMIANIKDSDSPIGKHVREIFDELIEHFPDFLTVFEANEEISIGQQHLHITISPLKDRQNRPRGRLITIHNITQLRQAEIRYQSLFNQAPDAILIEDKDKRIVSANPAASNMLGYSNEQLQTMTTSELLVDSQADTRQRIETKVKRADNTELLTDITLAPLVAGENNYRFAIMRDITNIRHTEQVLTEKLEQMSILRQINEEVSSTLKMDFVLSLSLDAAVRLSTAQSGFIVLASQSTNKPIPITHHIGEYPAGFEVDLNQGIINKVMTELTPIFVKDIAETPNYVPFLSDTRSMMLLPLVSQEHFIGILSLASNKTTTFTHEMFEFLKILADRIAVALDNARLYQQIKQQLDDLQKINEQLTIMRQVNEEVGSTLKMDFVLTISLDAAVRLGAAQAGFIVLADSSEESVEVAYRIGPYPADFRVNLSSGLLGEVIRNQQPQLITAIEHGAYLEDTRAAMIIPLTAHEQLIGVLCLETALDDTFTTDNFHFLQILTNRIAAALDNARLYQQIRQQLDELQKLYNTVSNLEQIKTDMIRVAAHDLGNPLASIFGYLQMFELDIDMLEGDHKEYIEAMMRSTRRMLDMRENILSLERIEQIARMETKNNFNLSKLVIKAVNEHHEQIAAKSQTLETDIKEDMELSGDDTQIYEALVNLISNAIKYTPEQGSIVVRLQLDDDHNILFTVEDTGYGIPDYLQERLFQPFYRAKTDETQGIAGTGLGLHLVKNIVERHQGQMIVNSVYGKGSMFGFKLPH